MLMSPCCGLTVLCTLSGQVEMLDVTQTFIQTRSLFSFYFYFLNLHRCSKAVTSVDPFSLLCYHSFYKDIRNTSHMFQADLHVCTNLWEVNIVEKLVKFWYRHVFVMVMVSL